MENKYLDLYLHPPHLAPIPNRHAPSPNFEVCHGGRMGGALTVWVPKIAAALKGRLIGS